MPKVSFIDHNERAYELDARTGASLMDTAVKNGVPGIDGDCGGACACATCHVYVTPDWLEAVGARTEMEQSMLEFADGVTEASRLACQIRVSDALDGLVVRLPQHQH